MVLIFVLLVFVLAQFFLSETLSGREAALRQLQGQVSELADVLALERKAKDALGEEVARLTDELQVSLSARQQLEGQVRSVTRGRRPRRVRPRRGRRSRQARQRSRRLAGAQGGARTRGGQPFATQRAGGSRG